MDLPVLTSPKKKKRGGKAGREEKGRILTLENIYLNLRSIP